MKVMILVNLHAMHCQTWNITLQVVFIRAKAEINLPAKTHIFRAAKEETLKCVFIWKQYKHERHSQECKTYDFSYSPNQIRSAQIHSKERPFYYVCFKNITCRSKLMQQCNQSSRNAVLYTMLEQDIPAKQMRRLFQTGRHVGKMLRSVSISHATP